MPIYHTIQQKFPSKMKMKKHISDKTVIECITNKSGFLLGNIKG